MKGNPEIGRRIRLLNDLQKSSKDHCWMKAGATGVVSEYDLDGDTIVLFDTAGDYWEREFFLYNTTEWEYVDQQEELPMKCEKPKQTHVWGLVDKGTGEVTAVRWSRAAARQDKGPNRTIRRFILVEAK